MVTVAVIVAVVVVVAMVRSYPPDLNPNFGTELVSDPYLTEFLEFRNAF